MAIPETQLETWSHQGAVTTASATNQAIQNALFADNSPVRGKDVKVQESKLKETFTFFSKNLERYQTEFDLEKLRGIIINRLILVNIDVDKIENPYLIFESLNAKGTPLTQADLIRNYIFMKIGDEDKQKELYKSYWRPMEILLKEELENFFWRYSLKDGTFVKIRRTYANLKSELETNTLKSAEGELTKLSEFSVFYKNMIDPAAEQNEEIRKRLYRHNQWEIRTAYPFLLNVYKDFSEGKVTQEDFCKILDAIESFVIRRFFCKEPTNKLNNLFIALYNQIDKSKFVESLEKSLLKDWPNDERFIEGIRTLPIYKSGGDKCRLILDTLEKSCSQKEKVDLSKETISIEHIMPRVDDDANKLPNEWKVMLGKDYKEIHANYLHTLGNLTLTGYNQELSVKAFGEKKKLLAASHLEMNKYFEGLENWNEQEILKRGKILSEKALNIWKHPKREK